MPSISLRFAIPLAAVSLVLTACSSSSNGDGNGGTPTCSVTLTGGMTATEACTGAAAAAYVASEDNTGIALTYNPPAGSCENAGFAAYMVFDGTIAAGHTYHSSDNGANGTLGTTLHGAAWYAYGGGSDPSNGSYAVTITSLTQTAMAGGNIAYTIHGTITATLVAQAGTGASGTVTVQASF